MSQVIRLELKGQPKGSKNNILVLRNGMRIPNPKFKAWSIKTIGEIRLQTPYKFEPLTNRSLVWNIEYTPEDNRRRDCTGILDGIMHCLEKSKIVSDDCIIKHLRYNELTANKSNPGVIITVTEEDIIK
jgi:hypothetical protein